jgi:hypothetical protein
MNEQLPSQKEEMDGADKRIKQKLQIIDCIVKYIKESGINSSGVCEIKF